jgi:hypothetical protein
MAELSKVVFGTHTFLKKTANTTLIYLKLIKINKTVLKLVVFEERNRPVANVIKICMTVSYDFS